MKLVICIATGYEKELGTEIHIKKELTWRGIWKFVNIFFYGTSPNITKFLQLGKTYRKKKFLSVENKDENIPK